jgi:hypothetical protein
MASLRRSQGLGNASRDITHFLRRESERTAHHQQNRKLAIVNAVVRDHDRCTIEKELGPRAHLGRGLHARRHAGREGVSDVNRGQAKALAGGSDGRFLFGSELPISGCHGNKGMDRGLTLFTGGVSEPVTAGISTWRPNLRGVVSVPSMRTG